MQGDGSNRAYLVASMQRWRREFNKAVKLPARDTIFDYFLSLEDGQCHFEPWTKHKIFKVIEFDSDSMQMSEVRSSESIIYTSKYIYTRYPKDTTAEHVHGMWKVVRTEQSVTLQAR